MKAIHSKNYKLRFLVLVFSLSLLGCQSKGTKKEPEEKPFTVFLVRHAEKVDKSKDPELSDAGKDRALKLAQVLKSTLIEEVYSTDYIRTRETAAPTAEHFGLETRLYNPKTLKDLADTLTANAVPALVVGHSNSTPNLVKLLGGDPGTPINEPSEYDRLYVITKIPNGQVSTVLLRYGSPYVPEVK